MNRKIVLAGLHLENVVDYDSQFEETKGLVEACEYEIVGEMIQKRRTPHPATFFGEGKVYEICYRKCLCDLYTKGLLKNGVLCECSRRSLLYNLESVFPEKKIEVLLLESILRGADECILRISIE